MEATSRNTGVAGKEEAQRTIGGASDTNAWRDHNFGDCEGVLADLKGGRRVGQVSAIVQASRNTESLAEATGAGGQGRRFCIGREPAVGRHGGKSFQRLESANEDAAGLALRLTGDVQTGIHAVDEVDVRMAGRSEEDLSTRCAACSGVSGGVIDAEVSLRFDDAADEPLAVGGVDKKLAQQPGRDLVRWPKIGLSSYRAARKNAHTTAGCGGIEM